MIHFNYVQKKKTRLLGVIEYTDIYNISYDFDCNTVGRMTQLFYFPLWPSGCWRRYEMKVRILLFVVCIP